MSELKLYSRPGNDLTYRFPLIVETYRTKLRQIAPLLLNGIRSLEMNWHAGFHCHDERNLGRSPALTCHA
jgi:hypothetical protein